MARVWRVLSIDGGGVRGIIPAKILAELEAQTGKPISELFDLVVASSAGGLIAGGLLTPDPSQPGKPRYTAAQIVSILAKEAQGVFPHSTSWWRKLWHVVHSKYSDRSVRKSLSSYFGDARLHEALTRLVLTSYDIVNRKPFLFRSETAKCQGSADFPLQAALRATSAAPSYFPPAEVPVSGSQQILTLIDGATLGVDPTMIALAEANATLAENDDQIILVSLGCGDSPVPSYRYKSAKRWGLLQWALPLVNIVFFASDRIVDFEVRQVMLNTRYYRLQPTLRFASDALDDATPANIAAIGRDAEFFIEANLELIRELCSRLVAPCN